MISRAATGDFRLGLRMNRWAHWRAIQRLFAVVSRLGDGVIWYAVILALPIVFGDRGSKTSLSLTAASLLGVGIYQLIKTRFRRPRPFISHPEILAHATALDEWSFPSGHTLHATSFLVLFALQLPEMLWIFAPFALLTALSRVILGLHYPSDVVAGAAVGAALGICVDSASRWTFSAGTFF